MKIVNHLKPRFASVPVEQELGRSGYIVFFSRAISTNKSKKRHMMWFSTKRELLRKINIFIYIIYIKKVYKKNVCETVLCIMKRKKKKGKRCPKILVDPASSAVCCVLRAWMTFLRGKCRPDWTRRI